MVALPGFPNPSPGSQLLEASLASTWKSCFATSVKAGSCVTAGAQPLRRPQKALHQAEPGEWGCGFPGLQSQGWTLGGCAVTQSQLWEVTGGECSFLCFSLIYPSSVHTGDLILWSF